MSKIKILDRNMINMIAAGEVIERPASVVKELMENSLDAGATQINVYVEDGGKNLIAITDNGCGMEADDLALAFEPHATSKLSTSADLLNISTMGFRGEALASIASVAKVSITSRCKDSIEANKIEIDCGEKENIRPCSGAGGTTIEVRNLFYKLPARRKFLKTANTEITHIVEQFTRIALARTDVGLTLSHNKKELYRLNAGESIRERIAKLFNAELAGTLLELQSSERDMKLSGMIGRPDSGRANLKFQYFFLNGRFIRDKFLLHAVKEAYRGLIEPDKFPTIFMFLQMPAQNFDVNVHPTKIEVRFDNSNLVYSQVLGVVREKLLSIDMDVHASLPKVDYNPLPEQNENKQRVADAMAAFFNNNKSSGASQRHFDFSNVARRSDSQAVAAREDFYSNPQTQTFSQTQEYLQIHDSYIVVPADDGFLIIDQHALHERIMYEELCRRLASEDSGKLQSQKLLIPETFEPTSAQLDALNDNKDLLDRLGIELEPFGPGIWAVQGFPTLLNKVRPMEFIADLLDILCDAVGKVDSERLLHKVLDMAACKAAVKAGQKLSPTEIAQLLADKQTVERAARCPHGRPTVIKFSMVELEKQFKRT
ncbi:MAG TPA: DNA mismatch repair endonuclease MutL [Phycisphaerales bacterium]|nr:DNA mismatch repair endonuclease MutL [Phycisphaerales bacterium]HBR19636.1 DNA mismatch repair endonuclease MutL [Phycisphaerales bacterium]